MSKASRIYRVFLCLLAFVGLLSIYVHTDPAFAQDLGRHIKIGELIVKRVAIPATNLFSFTNATFLFNNHHWLSEVIFYLAFLYGGQSALFALKMWCVGIAFGLLAFLSYKRRAVHWFAFCAVILAPLLMYRSTTRPELFGYMFFSLLLFILFSLKRFSRLLYGLPVIFALWVNVHITFVFGVLLLGALLFRFKRPFIPVFVLSLLSLLVNPQGVSGALYPLFIFGNYGYRIVENQNVFFLASLGVAEARYLLFLSVGVLAVAVGLFRSHRYTEALLLGFFYALTAFQIRHVPFFALTMLSVNRPQLLNKMEYFKKNEDLAFYLRLFFSIALFVFISTLTSNWWYRTFDIGATFGTAYEQPYTKATDFVKKNKLKGRIFNNFDIGGYLIYALYPRYRVFIDNRPEAYPADFFTETYIPLHTNAQLRSKVFKQYGINTIIYSHTDQTPWALSFLREIATMPQWRLVYLDGYAVIYTKESSIDDIRTKKLVFEQIMENKNYIELLNLARFFQLTDKTELASRALRQAQKQNPSSCAVRKILLTAPWWCR